MSGKAPYNLRLMLQQRLTTAMLSVLFVLSSLLALGQDTASIEKTKTKKPNQKKVSYSLKSPAASIRTHLSNLQLENFHPEISAKTIYPGQDMSLKQRKKLAKQLKQILDAKRLYIVIGDKAENPDYTMEQGEDEKVHKYILHQKMPEIYLTKEEGKWYYSQHTISMIPTWYKETFPFGLHRLLSILPPVTSKTFLGLALWQYIGLLSIILVAFILHKIFIYFLNSIISRIIHRVSKGKMKGVVRPLSKPASFFLVIYWMRIMVPVLQLPINFAKYLILAFQVAQPIAIVVLLYRMVDFVGEWMEGLADKTDTNLDDQLVPLVRKALRVFVVLIGMVWVLQVMDFDITTLLAGISIGGLAFALAAQDTIKNLFGSVTIFVDRPFQMGDWISGSGFDGTVEEVGFRTTRIRTFYDSVISVPNGQISNMTVDNYGMRTYRRYSTHIALTYDTPPPVIRKFIEGLKQIVEEHPDTRKDYYHVRLNQFSNSSIDILFYIFFKVPGWAEELAAREDIILAIIELAEDLGVNFAFPTQTLHVENLPGQPSLSPEYTTDSKQLDEKISAYMSSKYLADKKK